MIVCKELDQSFETKEELFKALRENADRLIDVKKSNVYKSIDKDSGVKNNAFKPDETIKADLNQREGYIYPVINTIGFLDSHKDLHVKGIWNKSVREQQGRVSYVLDHRLEIASTITWRTDVKMLVKDISWASVGKSYSGMTEGLIFEISKEDIDHEAARKALDKGWDVENSVRMRYMDVKLCYNSEAPEDKEYKKNFDKYYPQIANKDDFETIDWFYAVLQAQIVDEGSMVTNGSNSATRVIKNIEPSDDTQESNEAVNSHNDTLEQKGKLSIYNFN